MSGLTKKAVYADRLLATILGVNEGDFVSYAEISKGVHKYIKDKNLRTQQTKQPRTPTPPPAAITTPAPTTTTTLRTMKNCRDCGAEIPSEAAFCDLCGVSQ